MSHLTFFKLISFVTYSNLLLLSPNNGLSTPSLEPPETPQFVCGVVIRVGERVGAGRFELRIPRGGRDFSFLQKVQTGPGVRPASRSVGSRVFPGDGGLKRLGREVNHSPMLYAEVKNERRFLVCAFMVWAVNV